ncbi:hypothetical protein HO100_11435 [Corynebacterium ulcerans]|uniref:Uncharacterized protein n=1 Tax=Corynebacterium ulcerans FRC58 TaxID=1408268 RepID=A0ABN4H5D2_CORUL|nr:hypothetical protein [Corynebacterium ulcerans]AKN77511.1 Hypothetical protein CulFRC58_1657 [Corynebacterium ulcerans FRC58]NOL63372.1 hypothetical protein [Corynebacterium ulcerans]NON15698.1 hypothetical protein [Corynebacterium ulcerans]STC82369.1 Uncharacterised protein [Corynebacterium ulcerans]STD70896.1 Uncharacterised protein [Corynebacterium ulcerans]
MSNKNDIRDAVAAALATQPWFMRRKDTLAAIAGWVLQVGNFATGMAVGAPMWVSFLIAAVIGIAQIIIHAGTPGAITPSMGKRLTAVAPVTPVFDLEAVREQLSTRTQG